MDIKLKKKLLELLQNESNIIIKSNDELTNKLYNIKDIVTMLKVVEHFDELEPIIEKYFKDKTKKDRKNNEDLII